MNIQPRHLSQMHRVDYVDMTKGIGMLTIVWGHIMLSGWSNNLVYSFHIPLFFFLSGLLFNVTKYPSLGSFIKRRIKTLLVPYFIFSFMTWVFWAVMNIITHSQVNLWKPLLQTFIAQGSNGFMVHNVPLWFVTCLFVVELLYYFIQKLPNWLNIVICVICALIGDYMIRGGHLSFFRLLPWNLEGAMSAILFYSLGNLFINRVSHQTIVNVINTHKALFIFLISSLTVLLFFSANWNGHITLGSNRLGLNTLVFYGNAFIGIFTTISFSLLLTSIKAKWIRGGLSYLKWFGQNSFDVMATHVPIKGIVVIVVAWFFHSVPAEVSNNFKLSLIAFLITLFIDSVVVLLISMIKKISKSKKHD